LALAKGRQAVKALFTITDEPQLEPPRPACYCFRIASSASIPLDMGMQTNIQLSGWRAIGRPAAFRLLGLTLVFLAGGILPVLSSEPSSEQQIEAGISYRNDRFPEVPWSVHVIKVERTRPEFGFIATKAKDTVLGLSTLVDQVKSIPVDAGTPKAAINGDFYKTERERYPGDPRGLLIIRGELVSGPIDRACLWFDTAGEPRMSNVISQFKVTWPNGEATPMGLNEDPNLNRTTLFTPRLGLSTGTSNRIDLILERDGENAWLPLRIGENYSARVREIKFGGNAILATNLMVLTVTTQVISRMPAIEPGAVLKISTATSPDLRGAQTAIGGGPALVRGGKIVPLTKPSRPGSTLPYAERSIFERHPRSALAWNDKFFFFIEVDGRQKNLSIGMTLAELSDYLLKLGCADALNLDGGGSATIWLNGKVVNSPCFGYVRNTATAFVLVRKERP
jgi:hypothetical protein